MNTSMLSYLNLALLAVASLVYIAYDNGDSPIDSRPHLVFITTVSEGSTSATTIRSATSAIETDWNCVVTVIFTTDQPPSMARALKKALALEPDGVSMPGSKDERLLLPLVTEAHRQGIPVTYHTAPNPEAQRRFEERGAGFVGIEGEDSGYTLAEAAVERLGIAQDTPVLLVGPDVDIAPDSRLQGSAALLHSRGIATEYLRVAPAPYGTRAAAPDPGLKQRVDEGTLPRFIFWDSGPVGQLTSLLIEDRLIVADFRIVSLNPIKDDLPMLESRYIGLQAVDRSFLTCYFSLVQLILTDRYGLQGIEIPIGGV